MRVHDDLKGRVHRLEQRAQSRESLKNLQHLPDFDSFDVEFSPSAQMVEQTRYTFGGKVHDSTRFIYGERGELVCTLDLTAREISLAAPIRSATAKEGVSVGQFTTPRVR